MEENRAQDALFFYGSVKQGALIFSAPGSMMKRRANAVTEPYTKGGHLKIRCLFYACCHLKEEITYAAAKKTATAD